MAVISTGSNDVHITSAVAKCRMKGKWHGHKNNEGSSLTN